MKLHHIFVPNSLWNKEIFCCLFMVDLEFENTKNRFDTINNTDKVLCICQSVLNHKGTKCLKIFLN